MKKLLIACTIVIAALTQVQAQRAIGTWLSFLPYSSAIKVAQSDDRIYCATNYSIFYVEKSDASMSTLDKSKGLSDAGVRAMAYHPAKKTLIIAYNNSNIDLLVNGTDIYNLPDIKNAVIGSSKNINDVSIIGDYAYLATDLGISVIDLDKKEIKENYIIGKTGGNVKVTCVSADNNSIYAATTEGLKAAPLNSQNLQDFNNWKLFNTSDSIPAGEVSLVGNTSTNLYAVVKDTLYAKGATGHFIKVRYDAGMSYTNLNYSNGYLYASLIFPSGGSKVLKIKADGSMEELHFDLSNRSREVITDANTYWIADEWGGLQKYDGLNYSTSFKPSGPLSNGVFKTVVNENTLYMAPGGTDGSYLYPNFNRIGPVVYQNGEWKNYAIDAIPALSGCFDVLDVAIDNIHQKAYYASMLGGLIELDLTNGNISRYDTSNSILGKYFYVNQTRVTALSLDRYGNLWMCNPGNMQSLVLKTYDGNWKKFTVPNDLQPVRQMMVDNNGYVWMAGRGSTLNVYDPGQDLLDASDDRNISLGSGTGNGALPNNNVLCLTQDKNGDVWIGTDEGIGTFYCSGSLFSNNGCDADRIKVNRDGFIGYLFSTEIVKSIAVDGANRKWVGTTNGVWLISEDGKTELHKFTTENSPLPSNIITNISINQKTGEVFIGTEEGLVSYQGDAILGNDTKGTALVYPNPVKPDYTGPIAIKGLVDNAYVKITDAGGILVYQGRANGGQMIWDGKGYNGVKVSTGIYIVYAATDAGKEHNVGKIIFIN
jgi:ligand-binding sensor domain-containing protein